MLSLKIALALILFASCLVATYLSRKSDRIAIG